MNYTSTKDLRSGEQKHQEWRTDRQNIRSGEQIDKHQEWRTDRQTSGVENR